MPIGNVGGTPFQFMEMTDKYIEEQGISSNNVSQLPNNIANNTIENIQQQEYTNLRFATARLRKCVTRIGELIMERGDKDYIHPVEISHKEDNEVKYFSVVGSRGHKAYKKVNKALPHDIVTLNRKAKIRVKADEGMGLTQDGRRQAMADLMKNMIELYKEGFLGAEAMALMVKRFVEEYGYGATEDFMDAIEKGVTQGQMSQQQVKQMQIAILQTLKDAGVVGQEHEKTLTDSTKLGTLHALKDAGLLDQLNQEGKDNIEVDNMIKLYKDASPDIRRQIESKLGLQPASDEPISPSQSKSATDLHSIVSDNHAMDLNEKTHELAEKEANKPEPKPAAASA